MTYFLPINSTSLAHYFVCACVKPARYFENKPQDIQDRFRDALLLSTELGTKDTDCCIELVLTENEKNSLVPCGKDFYLLPIPLPVSRVKTVFFRNQRQLEQTVEIINMSAAFIPRSLAKVEAFSNTNLDVAHVEDLPSEKDFTHAIEMYDRILGALALMKTAKEPYMNYSENYASTLSFFNGLIKSELTKQGRPINEKFFGLFERTGSFENFIPYLEKKITKEDFEQIAAKNNQKIERSYSKVINYDKLSGYTYAIAILQSYGVGVEAATKKIDGLITTNFAELKDGKEGIALYYGYNRGYSVFSNSYGTEETGRQTVKYCLDSQLDYYTLESVYQFAFYSKTAAVRFPYLDEWCPKKKERPKRKTDYLVLDTAFIGKKKPSVFSEEYLLGFLAEIKTFDFITIPIASLVKQVRDRVANDTKEEIEDAAETKFTEAQAIIESLKGKIASQDGIISDLLKKNESLVKEIASLKSTTGQYPTKVVERAGLLQEPEVKKYGSESIAREQNDLPGKDMPIGDTSITVDSYSSSKKGGRLAKAKSGSTKSKATSKPSKKAANKVLGGEHGNVVTEAQALEQEIVTKPSTDNGGNPTLFDSDERGC